MKNRIRTTLSLFLCILLVSSAIPLAYGSQSSEGLRGTSQESRLTATTLFENEGGEEVVSDTESSSDDEAPGLPEEANAVEENQGAEAEALATPTAEVLSTQSGEITQPAGTFAFKREYPVKTGNDDAYASATNANLVDAALYLHGRIGAIPYANYVRFAEVDLPQDAVITNAYLSFTTYAASTQTTTLSISGELGANSAFSASASSFTSRRFTAPTPAVQTPLLGAGATCNTEDITGILNQMRLTNTGIADYVFRVQGSEFGNLLVRSYNYNPASAPKLVVEYYSTQGSYSSSISDIWDDAEEYGTGKAIAIGGGMEIGGYFATALLPPYKEINGFRFSGVELPANARITDAYMEFTTLATNLEGRVSNMVIRGEIGDAARYQAVTGNISARTYGELAVRYQQPAFTTARQTVRTPNLKSIIDENRLAGWQSGQALAFCIDGDNYIGNVYEGSTAYAPRLVIRYEYTPYDIVDSMASDPATLGNIFINEVAPLGTAVETRPWIELYNANDFAVVLGSSVSLGTGVVPNRQVFSNFLIPAKGYRTVLASGLPFDEGTLTLSAYYNNAYYTLDTLALGTAQYEQTWGRFIDGGSDCVTYPSGTYAASNQTLNPTINYSISHTTGMYQSSFSLVIDTDTVNTVVYTLDGSTPSAQNGTVYTGALTIPDGQVSNLRVYVYNERNAVGPYSYRYIVGQSELDMRAFTKEYAIQSGLDDAYANQTRVNLYDAALYLNGAVGAVSYDNYLRFANVSLPEDAVVTNAYIEFTSYTTYGQPTQITVAGELGVGGPFSTVASSFGNRSFTSPSAAMSMPIATAGQKYQTGDISDIVNEMRYTTQGISNYVFKIAGDRNGTLMARSYNYAPTFAPRLCVEYYSGYGDTSKTITNYLDDAEEYGLAKAIALDGAMEIGGYFAASSLAPYKEVNAFRFTDIEIPEDAEITNAYMEFTTLGIAAAGRVSHQQVRVELGDAAAYSATAGSISARSYGDLSVSYDQNSFTSARQTVRTPNLRDLIDETRLRGWKSGDALAFLVDGDNFIGSIYQGSTLYAPKLVVEYKFSGRGAYITGAVTDASILDNVFINEISSEGTSSSKSDWIELYNANAVPVVLGGEIGLWRDKNRKEAHTFNNFMIPAGGYRIVYFDEDPGAGNDHADFELKGSAELLLVSFANGAERIIHQLAYPGHLYNDTFGLRLDGGSEVVPFAQETFCASNNSGQEKYEVVVSHDRGVYDTRFLLSISSRPGTTIRYTLDGTTPSSSAGQLYLRPLSINTSCIVKIFAHDATGNSRVNTFTYVLLDNYQNEQYRFNPGFQNGYVWQHKQTINASQYAVAMADLPIVSVSTDAPNLRPNADYVPGTFEFLDSHLGGSNYNASVGLKRFGQVSITQYNANTAIRFHRNYNSTKAKYTFFTVGDNPGKFARLDLKEGQDGPQANVFNLGYLRYDESVTNTLAAQMGKPALDTEYVHSFYNGQYMGVKTMREHFNDNYAEDNFGGDSDDYTKIRYQDGTFTYGVVEAGDGLSAMNTKVIGLANSRNFQEFKKYVDVDNMIKTQILFMFIDSEREIDALIHNDVASGDGLKMTFNINDTDGAFYNNGGSGTSLAPFAGGGGTYRYKWTYDVTSRWGAGRMFGNFSGDSTNPALGNLEFKTMVKDQVLEMIGPANGDYRGAAGAPLSADNVTQVIVDNQNQLQYAYQLDAAYMGVNSGIYNAWLDANLRTLNQVDDRVSFSLQMWKHYNMAHTLSAVDVVKTSGGITLTNTNAQTTAYYTLDGSDPMGADGVVSASALAYTPGTILPADATLTVRAFTTNNWGPLSYS